MLEEVGEQVMTALVTNPYYGKVGLACGLLKTMVQHMQALVDASPGIVPVLGLEKARAIAASASEYMTVAFAVWHRPCLMIFCQHLQTNM